MVEYTSPAGTCPAASGPGDTLIGKSGQGASTLLNDCLWYASEWGGKALLGMVDYRGEHRSLGIRDGKMI